MLYYYHYLLYFHICFGSMIQDINWRSSKPGVLNVFPLSIAETVSILMPENLSNMTDEELHNFSDLLFVSSDNTKLTGFLSPDELISGMCRERRRSYYYLLAGNGQNVFVDLQDESPTLKRLAAAAAEPSFDFGGECQWLFKDTEQNRNWLRSAAVRPGFDSKVFVFGGEESSSTNSPTVAEVYFVKHNSGSVCQNNSN